MTTMQRYREQNAARLKSLVDAKNKAVQAVQQEIDRQQGRSRTPVSQAVSATTVRSRPQKAITPAARDEAVRQVREQWAADQDRLQKLEHLAWREDRLSRVQYFQY